MKTLCHLSFLFLVYGLPIACGGTVSSSEPGGGVGDVDGSTRLGEPCVSADEDLPEFAGHSTTENTIERRDDDLVCLVTQFQGRQSCPLGQPAPNACAADADCDGERCVGGLCISCFTREGAPVTTAVCGQCSLRPSTEQAFFSCRCGRDEGQPDDGEPLCDCPSSMACEPIVPHLGLGPNPVAGHYCVRTNTVLFGSEDGCGEVAGYWNDECEGDAPY